MENAFAEKVFEAQIARCDFVRTGNLDRVAICRDVLEVSAKYLAGVFTQLRFLIPQ